jgi:hypothetical protein
MNTQNVMSAAWHKINLYIHNGDLEGKRTTVHPSTQTERMGHGHIYVSSMVVSMAGLGSGVTLALLRKANITIDGGATHGSGSRPEHIKVELGLVAGLKVRHATG